ASWTSYQGIRFWVKRISGSEQGAALQLLWTRHYAGFPLADSWTEVTMRWQEFTQRLYEGTCESKLAGIDTIEFTRGPPSCVSPGDADPGRSGPAGHAGAPGVLAAAEGRLPRHEHHVRPCERRRPAVDALARRAADEAAERPRHERDHGDELRGARLQELAGRG